MAHLDQTHAHRRLALPIQGMDCVGCAHHVKEALEAVPGVKSADVLVSSERAIIQCEAGRPSHEELRAAVKLAGYSVPAHERAGNDGEPAATGASRTASRQLMAVLGLVFGAVLFVAVVGEWLGFFETIGERVPFPIGLVVVLMVGWPAFRTVFEATLRRQVVSHTLMTVGVIAALAIGQWVTAAVVAFFMRVGVIAERFTTERGRAALKGLVAEAPSSARMLLGGVEVPIPLDQVIPGDIVLVRPGEKIPVDGEVVDGGGAVDQSSITGESIPVQVTPGANVFATTILSGGALRVRVSRVGPDSTFGQIVRMVEEAETNRSDVQRYADRFSTQYLPIVAAGALLTFIVRRDPLATAAVLVVACSCAFALATPIAMLASIGAGAKRGLLVKGGKYLESLARADVVLLDKTGTLTLGRPEVVQVVGLGDVHADRVIELADAAERYSEHPLARAILKEAARRGIAPHEPEEFEAIPARGVRARVQGLAVEVGRSVAVDSTGSPGSEESALALEGAAVIDRFETQGITAMVVSVDGTPIGIIGVSDSPRPEVPEAVAALKRLGISHIEILTGDDARVAARVAEPLGVRYRARLLPEDKIEVVREYQQQGHVVVMVGDGVNDAPALAQADVGIAMGVDGTDVAMEAAHVVLLREDWSLVPQAFRLAQRTMGVVKMNLGFTALYNAVGLTLAAVGILPPILAAAAHLLPDLGILANSSRLLRWRSSLARSSVCAPRS